MGLGYLVAMLEHFFFIKVNAYRPMLKYFGKWPGMQRIFLVSFMYLVSRKVETMSSFSSILRFQIY